MPHLNANMKKPYNTNKETSNNHERSESDRYEGYEKKQKGYSDKEKSEGKGSSNGKSWKSYKGCK